MAQLGQYNKSGFDSAGGCGFELMKTETVAYPSSAFVSFVLEPFECKRGPKN